MRKTRFVAAGVLALMACTAVPAAAAPVSPRDGVMPSVVGKTVWEAEGAVPLGTHLTFVDATGQHRKIVWPTTGRCAGRTQPPASRSRPPPTSPSRS